MKNLARVQLVRRTLGVALLAALSSNCASSGDSTTPSETTAATTATTTTIAPTTTIAVTTTTISQLELAKIAYYLLSAESNGARTALYEPYPSGVPWSKLPEVCAQEQIIDETFARKLLDYKDWPDDAQEAINALAAKDAAIAFQNFLCSEAPGTYAAQRRINDEIVKLSEEATELATTVRLLLGLPLERG